MPARLWLLSYQSVVLAPIISMYINSPNSLKMMKSDEMDKE